MVFYIRYRNVLGKLMNEIPGIVELQNPEECPTALRDEMQAAAEGEQFCNEHYAADYEEDYYAQSALAFAPIFTQWQSTKQKSNSKSKSRASSSGSDEASVGVSTAGSSSSGGNGGGASAVGARDNGASDGDGDDDGTEKMPAALESVDFNKRELEQLLRLPRKEYILSDPKAVMISLIDLVFAWAYVTTVCLVLLKLEQTLILMGYPPPSLPLYTGG